MERLTQRLRTGEVLMASEYEEKYTEQEWISVLQDRLAAYEDPGLTPEEVTALQKDWSDLCTIIGECGGIDRVRSLAEGDVHGRWIHYPDCGVTRCSHCGWSIEECWESKRCPECGANMYGNR